MPNLTRIFASLASIFASAGSWTADEARVRWDSLMLLLKTTILVPVMLFVIGELVGRCGVWIDSAWMVTVAKGTFAFGSVIGALLVTWLWTRLMLYGHGGALAAAGFASLHDRLKPAITREQVDAFLVWLRGWTAWYIGALLILTYVPVYKSLVAAAILVAGLLLMAAIMSAQWSHSNWPRRILSFFAICIIVGQILYLVAPETHAAMNAWTGSQAARLTAWANTQSNITRVEAAAEQQEELDISARLEKNHARLSELRQKATKRNCAGVYCQEDAAEYRNLQKINATLRQQALIDVAPSEQPAASGSKRPSPSKAPVARPAVKRTGSVGRLPPPPRVTSTPRSGGSHHRRRRATAKRSSAPAKRERDPSGFPRVTHREIDDIFAPIN